MLTFPMLHDQRRRKVKGSSYVPPDVSRVGMCSGTENGSPAQAAAPAANAPTFRTQPTMSPSPSIRLQFTLTRKGICPTLLSPKNPTIARPSGSAIRNASSQIKRCQRCILNALPFFLINSPPSNATPLTLLSFRKRTALHSSL